ncbi:hypothetical protein [Streptomyces chartreusis]|uniref:hypothetical protein n=1 Tax=Streptomyces chartreusis TaxID=1969 RepID=UPI0033FE57ED
MMQAEQHGEHAKADELAFAARNHGTLQPLRLLVWHRLQQSNTLDLGTALAHKANDAGEAPIVKAGHHDAVDALQRTFDESDDQRWIPTALLSCGQAPRPPRRSARVSGSR